MAPFAGVAVDIAELVGDVAFDPEALRRRYREERDKRLRPDGNDQYVEVKGDFAHYVDDPYVEPGFTREPLFDHVDVAVIGAGFGGLLAAARLREAGLERIRLIDRAGDVGGTWYWNRYPGAACDVESYIYLPLLEELGYVPRHRYSYAPEISAHCRNIARHFDLYEDACFQTSVSEVAWDEQRRHWVIGTDRGDRMTAQFVVSATGPLSRPKLPGIPGIDDFAGHTFHTSRWDYGYTGGDPSGGLVGLQDKRVGVIGTGATAIQCVPYLAEWARQLYVFQRTPSSVDFRGQVETDEDWFRSQEPGWQRRRMQNFTSLVSGGEEEKDLVGDGWTDIFRNLTGHAAKHASRALGRRLTPLEKWELIEMFDFRKMEQIRSRVEDIVSDPATAEALKPWYRQFCKRPCYHDDYLHAFNRPNVTLVDTDGQGVERMTRDAVVAGGIEYEVDCLIFATGFEVGTSLTRRMGYDIAGRGGVPLSDAWRDGVRTVHGFQTRGFPNLFFVGFMQSAFTVNLAHALDEQAQHLAYILGEVRSRGHEVVEATKSGEDAWVGEVRSTAVIAERFYSECTPGYYNNEGQVTRDTGLLAGQYGGGPVRFFEILRNWRDEGALAGLELG
jgi:cation diffusion facilitator CzcD-associated flavoprotein CzcO